MTTTAGTQLRAAATLLRERGLSKGALDRQDGSICAMRALGMVAGDVADMNRLWARMLRVVGLPERSFLSEWNDDPARTEDEVVAAFERAADLADAEAVKLQVWWKHPTDTHGKGKAVPNLAAALELVGQLSAVDVPATINVLDPTSGEWLQFDPTEPAEMDELRLLLGEPVAP